MNLIGEHTDYNGGLVLPLAIDLECVVTATPRHDRLLTMRSAQLGDGGEVSLDERDPGQLIPWVRYVAGVAWALQDDGFDIVGADLLIDSQVPAGAGLSSSAALECSVGLALAGEIAPMRLAKAAQRAETDVVGAPVGIMDQVASAFGSEHGPLLLDCATLEVRPVSWDLKRLVLVVIDTRVAHDHATGGYATRRNECDRAAAALGVTLREATLDQADLLPEPLNRRVRHVVTENQRVLDVAAALERGDLDALGPLLAAGHASLRDDFEVSCPELDAAVQGALDGGAIAARMTGGGFGGSAIALSPPDRVDAVTRSCREAAAALGAPKPVVRTVRPSRGARRVG